jgi:hypothetical protein
MSSTRHGFVILHSVPRSRMSKGIEYAIEMAASIATVSPPLLTNHKRWRDQQRLSLYNTDEKHTTAWSLASSNWPLTVVGPGRTGS